MMLATTLFCGAFMGLACNAADPDPTTQQSEKSASVRIALETTSASGTVYKLADAVFEFEGPTPTSVSADLDHVGRFVSVVVAPGEYNVHLKDGWRLVQDTGLEGGRLISANPQHVVLVGGRMTDVVFRFSLNKDALKKDEAGARVGISVEDPLCGNGRLDPGEECDKAISYPGGRCDERCTGGIKPCSTDGECASNTCDLSSRCDDCQRQGDTCRHDCEYNRGSCGRACSSAVGTCKSNCDTGLDSCRNTCGDLSEACWASCWFDPIGCAATCEPPRAVCMNVCTANQTSCHDRCADTQPACDSACDTSESACVNRCGTTQSSCSANCGRCVSCSDARMCPNEVAN